MKKYKSTKTKIKTIQKQIKPDQAPRKNIKNHPRKTNQSSNYKQANKKNQLTTKKQSNKVRQNTNLNKDSAVFRICMETKQSKISSGTFIIDELVGGGYDSDIITTIYGPSGTGKTNLCLIAATKMAKSGKKVIYIDTEGGFSIARLKQLAGENKEELETITNNIIFLKPTSFGEQKKAFIKLQNLITKDQNIGLIIVDTISMLYRLEIGKSNDIYETNRELGKQLCNLTMIARKREIPVLITNQVYANFKVPNTVSMVGGDLLKYGSKCIIELQNTPDNNRRAILKKHRSIAPNKETIFKIINSGIAKVSENKSFSFFRK